MARQFIQRYQVHQVRAVAPKNVDVEPNTILDDDAGVISCEFKVYDTDKDEVISANEASGQTELSVTNVGVFNVNETVEITQDNATIRTTTISSIDSVNGTITVSDALTANAKAGNRVRRIFGTSVSMLEYGIADLDERDWGYKGTFLGNHAAHLDTRAKTGLDIDIEINFDGGTDLEAFDVICATIKQDECD